MSSSLRRRVAGDTSQDSPSADDQNRAAKDSSSSSPAPKSSSSSLKKSNRGSKRWNLFVLGIGGVLGIVAAGWFAQNNEMIDLAAIAELNLETIADILPAGLLQDAKDLQVSLQMWGWGRFFVSRPRAVPCGFSRVFPTCFSEIFFC